MFILALFFLIKSSDYFVDSAENLGIFIGLPGFVIGLLVFSLGTSLPELVSSVFSVFKDSSEIVIATVIGSNIANIFLVIGISAIFAKKLKIDYDIVNNDLPLFAASAFLLGFIVLNLKVTIFEAILCILMLLFYIIFTFKISRDYKDKEIKKEFKSIDKKAKKQNAFKNLGMFIFSMVLIYFSAKYLIEAIIQISSFLNIAKEIIAISAVAFGTSLPELFVSVNAARKGKPELAIGNVLGSNIFNSVGVIGVSALFGSLVIPKSILMFGIPFMIVATLLYFFIVQDRVVTYIEGFTLLIFYLFFLGFMFGII